MIRGHTVDDFADAFQRYLPPMGGAHPAQAAQRTSSGPYEPHCPAQPIGSVPDATSRNSLILKTVPDGKDREAGGVGNRVRIEV